MAAVRASCINHLMISQSLETGLNVHGNMSGTLTCRFLDEESALTIVRSGTVPNANLIG